MRKRIILILLGLMLLFAPSLSFGAWTLTATSVDQVAGYFVWKVVCVSDGNELTSTNLIDTTGTIVGMDGSLKGQIRKRLFAWMDVIVNTAPDNSYTVSLTNQLTGAAPFYSHTISTYATSTNGYDMAEDTGYVPPCPLELNLAVTDIGSNNDSITLVFWMY